jgi:prolyl-tRNA synthetase
MKYNALNIQTQRNAPSDARALSYALLNRAAYIPRIEPDFGLLPLGERTLSRLRAFIEATAGPGQDIAIETEARFGVGLFGTPLSLGIEVGNISSEKAVEVFKSLGLNIIHISNRPDRSEIFFATETGAIDLLACPACGYTTRAELAVASKTALPSEEPLPIEKMLTPDCPTIEALANFLGVPQEKTAKALMFTRLSDSKLIFGVVRGDMNLSEEKLARLVGEVRPATEAEISAAGAVPGYASPLGLNEALVIVDELIPRSTNLVAGANEHGYHLKNVNYGRDYTAALTADLTQAKAGDICPHCGEALAEVRAERLFEQEGPAGRFDLGRILAALAEAHHDEYGLSLPAAVAPFDVYLMLVPGKTMDTEPAADELYKSLEVAGISVLYDDRNERAGVKFNDADLIGCPVRVTVGERGLLEGVVELKARTQPEKVRVSLEKAIQEIQTLLG